MFDMYDPEFPKFNRKSKKNFCLKQSQTHELNNFPNIDDMNFDAKYKNSATIQNRVFFFYSISIVEFHCEK